MSPEIPPDWRAVHFREYPEALDLTGRDLISLAGRSKDEVAKVVGPLAAKTDMQLEELPGEYVTSLTGEIADEVHEWPNATLGSHYRNLMLQFHNGNLSHMRWKFQAGAPAKKPWWRLW